MSIIPRSKITHFLLVAVAIFCLAAVANASHFRYGTISSTPLLNGSGQPTGTMTFTLKVAYRRSFGFTCSPAAQLPSCNGLSLVTGNTFTGSDRFYFGDGTSSFINPLFTVTSYDTTQDWIVAQATFTHAYGTAPASFTAYFGYSTNDSNVNYGCCRADPGGVTRYRLQTIVRPLTTNHSPTSSLPPIVSLPVNQAAASFFLPASDFDGDQIRFRLSTSLESGLGSSQNGVTPPNTLPVIAGNPTINSSTGQVIWNTTGLLTTQFYAVQFMVEDLDGSGNVKSQTPVDVVMQPVNASGTGPTCKINGSISAVNLSVAPGSPISFGVIGTDPDSTGSPALPVTLSVSGLPTGSTMTPSLTLVGPSPVSSTFNWIPTDADVGTHSMSFSCVDNTFLQTINSVNITVNILPPVITSPTNGYSSTSQTVAVAGTANPNASVELFNGATSLGLTTADGSGHFSKSVTVAFGVFSLTAKQTQNGLTSQASNTVTGTIVQSTSTVTPDVTSVYGGPITLQATLKSGVTPVAGKTIDFTLNGLSAGSAVTNAGGVATVLAPQNPNAGVYAGGIVASFAGDALFAASAGSGTLTVSKAATTTTVSSDHQSPLGWSQLSATGTGPSQTTCGQSTVADGSGRLIVYARTACGGGTAEVWVLNGANGVGSPGWSLVASGGPVRHAQTVVYDKATNRLILFGGCGGGCLPVNNDVWILTNANGTGGTAVWTQLSTTGGPPAARDGAAGVYDPVSNRLIIYGGQDGGGQVVGETDSDVWVLTNVNVPSGTHAWSQLSTTGAFPKGVYQPRAFYDSVNNRLTVAGGARSDTGTGSSAVNVLTNANGLGGTPAWTNLIAEGAAGAQAIAGWNVDYDAAHNRGILSQPGSPNLYYLNNANGLGGPTSYTLVTPTGGAGSAPSYGLGFDTSTGRTTTWYEVGGTDPAYVLSGGSSSIYGDLVTFTANVSSIPSFGTITGTVQFFDGVTPVGGPQTVSGASASVSTSSLTVGAHNLSAVYSGDGNFGGSSSSPLSHTVNAKAVTVTADPKTITFGGADPTFTYTATGLIGADVLTGVTCSVAGAHSAAGTYAITCSGNTNGNYSVTYVAGTLTVNPKAATVTADPKTITYGGADPTFTYIATGLVGADVLTGVTCSVTGAHSTAGTYPITCSGNTNGNYSVTYVAGTLTVNPKAATVTADPKTITYGDADPAFTFTASGLVGSDALTGVTCSVAGAHSAAGTYAITCSGNTNGNYSVTYVAGTLTVNKAQATASAIDGGGVYNGSPYTGSGSCSNSLTPAITYAGGSAPVHAGTTSFTVTCGDGGHNYIDGTKTGSIVITKASVTAKAGSGSGTYNALTQSPAACAVTGSYTGGLTCANSPTSVGPGAGTTSITPVVIGDQTDFIVTLENGSYTINKAQATATAPAGGGEYNANPFIGPGTCSDSLTPAVVYSGGSAPINAGTTTYTVTCGDGGINYIDGTATGNIVITKANANVTVNGYTGTYDAAAHGATGTATGVAGVDLSSGLNLGATFTNVPGGTATWTFTGGNNYNDQGGTAAIDISKANAHVTVNGYTGTYDAAAHGATGSASGVGGFDLSSGLNLGATFTNVPGGTASWTFTGGNNYNDQGGTAAIDISKANPSVTVNGYTGIYDATAHGATGSASGVGGVNLSSGLSIVGTFTDVPGGTASWTFTGGDNYNDQNGTAAVDISKAPSFTQVTCSGTSFVYDGTPQTPCSVTVSGVLLTITTTADYSANTDVSHVLASYTYLGDPNHSGSSGAAAFDITKAPTTVAVTESDTIYDGNSHPGSAAVTGVNGLNDVLVVTYTGRNGTVYAATTDAPVNVGDYTASANYPGTDNYADSVGSKDFTIGKADSVTTVTCTAGPFIYNGSAGKAATAYTPCIASVAGAGTLAGALPVSYSNNVNAGTATASATFDGDSNHNGSGASQTFQIAKADQSISFGSLSPTTFGAADFSITATSTSGLPVSLVVTGGTCTLSPGTSPSTVHITGAGICSITASQFGDGNFNAAPSESRSFSIAKAAQVITFAPLGDVTFGVADFNVSATGGASGNPVTFTATGYCTVSVNTVHITGAGLCTIKASQAGNANYDPAADQSRSFTIGLAASAMTVTAPPYVANGGGLVISGVLTGVANVPLAGQTITFTIGNGLTAQSCTGTTNALGAASCTIANVNQPLGPGLAVTSAFGGNSNYLGSGNSTSTFVYAYAAGAGAGFMIGDRNAAVGTNVTYWGAQWTSLNSLSGGAAPAAFKGFANRSSTTPASSGATWTTDPGNSSNPPATVPVYMAVIVSSTISKSGSVISGNTTKVVIVKTNTGYAADPGHAGTGTIVAVLP